MSTTFPERVDNYLVLQDGIDSVFASHSNDRGDAITSIETFLGSVGYPQSRAVDLLSFLTPFFTGWRVSQKSDSEISIDPGVGIITDKGETKKQPRRTTERITLDVDSLDEGVFEKNTFYSIYASADTIATVPIFIISASSFAPLNATHYKKIGWFHNESDDVLNISKGCIGNNREHGNNPNCIQVIGTSDISTASREFIDMADMRIPFMSNGRPIRCSFYCTVHPPQGGGAGKFTFAIDGTEYGLIGYQHDGHREHRYGRYLVSGERILQDIVAGEHSISLQWKAETGTLYQPGSSYERGFIVEEL